MHRRLHQKGFTIPEVIFVVLILGVLIGVVAVAYRGVEARNRNQDRATAINAVQKQLEAFYQTNNHYPSLRDMNDEQWLKMGLKSLDTALLRDPASDSTTLSAQPQANSYAYQPVDITGASCEDNDEKCVAYTLTATLEGGGQYVKQNTN